MTFVKGKSGNPNGMRPTPWAEALRITAHEPVGPDGKKRLRLLAEKTFELAMDGNLEAIQEIGNRLDGRPAQAITANVTTDATIDYAWVEQLTPDHLRALAVIAAKAAAAEPLGAATVN